MGLFSFITDAGGKLGSKIYDLTHEEEDFNKPVTISPERMNELRKAGIEKTLKEELGESVEHVSVAVDGDKVTLTGPVVDQATAEKATLCAGNVHGIATVDCSVDVENKEPEAQFYTVQAGDSLGKIAKQFYDNAGKYPVIFEANKPLLTDPNKIYPGQTLRIPAL